MEDRLTSRHMILDEKLEVTPENLFQLVKHYPFSIEFQAGDVLNNSLDILLVDYLTEDGREGYSMIQCGEVRAIPLASSTRVEVYASDTREYPLEENPFGAPYSFGEPMLLWLAWYILEKVGGRRRADEWLERVTAGTTEMNESFKEVLAPVAFGSGPERSEGNPSREGGPTAKTQARADVFKRLKDEHPDWTQLHVATKACEELEESVTEDTVRNTYRAMGWKWKRGDRIR
jgi:hypothetical protein